MKDDNLRTPADTPLTEISRLSIELDEATTILLDWVQRLEDHLTPFLRSEPSQEKENTAPILSTPMGGFLHDKVNRVNRAVSSLRDILNRSEI